MDQFLFEADELLDIVDGYWTGGLCGCAFEDLMKRIAKPDGLNLVDDYIRRRGWNEGGAVKLGRRAL